MRKFCTINYDFCGHKCCSYCMVGILQVCEMRCNCDARRGVCVFSTPAICNESLMDSAKSVLYAAEGIVAGITAALIESKLPPIETLLGSKQHDTPEMMEE